MPQDSLFLPCAFEISQYHVARRKPPLNLLWRFKDPVSNIRRLLIFHSIYFDYHMPELFRRLVNAFAIQPTNRSLFIAKSLARNITNGIRHTKTRHTFFLCHLHMSPCLQKLYGICHSKVVFSYWISFSVCE